MYMIALLMLQNARCIKFDRRSLMLDIDCFNTFSLNIVCARSLILVFRRNHFLQARRIIRDRSGGHLSKEFFELVKAIGESRSKQEEDRTYDEAEHAALSSFPRFRDIPSCLFKVLFQDSRSARTDSGCMTSMYTIILFAISDSTYFSQ